jgi:hypothetical protein
MNHEVGEHLTFESLLDDTLDLLRKWVAVVRATVADVGKFESGHPERSSNDKAISRWQMYLGVMIVKAAEAIADLSSTRNVRAMTVLLRAVYEYQVKAEFFLNHGKEAELQLLSVPARRYGAMSKMAFPNPRIAPILAAEHLEWKRTAGKLDEYSGNVAFNKMHLANSVAEKNKTGGASDKIKLDAAGKEYTEEFTTLYGTASWYTHGEPALIPEVFRKLKDEFDWGITEDYTYFDTLTVLGAANASLPKFVLKTCEAYAFGIGRMLPLDAQTRRTVVALAKLHARAGA